jgi:hypothetical protein
MVEIYNDTNQMNREFLRTCNVHPNSDWHTACNIEEQELQKFIIENNISSFMVQPVAIYNGQTLMDATKRLGDLSDPFFDTLREGGSEIILYQLYKHDPSSTSYNKYLVRYATYNGI